MAINQFANSFLPFAGDAISEGMALYRTKKQTDQYRQEEQVAANEVKILKASRQDVVDPSSALEDLSGTFSNAFANLGVATRAAEIQMEQTDAALANTLDTLRATGSGAGGATALAQAALQSKNAVAADIQSQEAANQKLAARGEQELQTQIAAEKTRIQEGKSAGIEYVYNAEEERRNADLDYAANKEGRNDQKEYASEQELLKMKNNASLGGSLAAIGLDKLNISGFGG